MTKTNDDVVRGMIVGSPLASLLGITAEAIEPDRVRLCLPYRAEVTTAGDVVHGGAIASLIDVAATAAAWSTADLAHGARGTTVGLTVSFLTAARAWAIAMLVRLMSRYTSSALRPRNCSAR